MVLSLDMLIMVDLSNCRILLGVLQRCRYRLGHKMVDIWDCNVSALAYRFNWQLSHTEECYANCNSSERN